jgi:hypothetical protein
MVGVLSYCLNGTTPLDCAVGVRDAARESRHQRDPD